MEFESLLSLLGKESIFSTGLLLAGEVDPKYIHKQLSRWVRSKKIIQLRRGLYALEEPYCKSIVHPFVIANRLQPGSFVSLQSALAYHGLIPEYVPVTTSVTTGRPGIINTPLGTFTFRHIQNSWFMGYKRIQLDVGSQAFIADAEKALLDLIYLQPGGGTTEFIQELRLQNLVSLNREILQDYASRSGKAKLMRAYNGIIQGVEHEEGYGIL